jgi:hypothetical protein
MDSSRQHFLVILLLSKYLLVTRIKHVLKPGCDSPILKRYMVELNGRGHPGQVACDGVHITELDRTRQESRGHTPVDVSLKPYID